MKNLSSLTLRIITGACLLSVVAVALYLQGWLLRILVLLIAVGALREFYLLFPDALSKNMQLLGMASGILCLLPVFMQSAYPLVGLFLAVPILLTCFLFSWAKNSSVTFIPTALVFGGIVYIPVALAAIFTLNIHEQIFVLGVTVLADTAAYFAGSAFGKHKIWPVVSPKKSVEGAAAGVLAVAIWTCGMGHFYGSASMGWYIVLGCVLAVVSMLGDFFESALKRMAGVKDSGNILPGHGGLLDRIDSLLFVLPVYSAVSCLMPMFWMVKGE